MNEKIACITLDIEPDLGRGHRVSLFEDEALMEQYVAIVHRHDVKVTGFLVTGLLGKYARAIERFSQRIPIEFAVHSHRHDHRNACSREEIGLSLNAYQSFLQTDPLGYRAPYGLIDRDGINHLLDFGFKYDASIFPSRRFDRYGYSNLHLPNEPFRLVRGDDSLIELPFASLQTIRLVFSLSYAKLLGLSVYKMLMILFSLPDIVVFDSHPYDFYVHLVKENAKGWKKLAHLRNAKRASNLFEEIIVLLKTQGYRFMHMSELYHRVVDEPDLPQPSIDDFPPKNRRY